MSSDQNFLYWQWKTKTFEIYRRKFLDLSLRVYLQPQPRLLIGTAMYTLLYSAFLTLWLASFYIMCYCSSKVVGWFCRSNEYSSNNFPSSSQPNASSRFNPGMPPGGSGHGGPPPGSNHQQGPHNYSNSQQDQIRRRTSSGQDYERKQPPIDDKGFVSISPRVSP